MTINIKNRRQGKRAIGLQWAAALAFAAAVFSACGTDPPERSASADEAGAEAPGRGPAIAPAPGIAFANSEDEQQERYDAERRAAIMQRAASSDRHLETLADQIAQQAWYEHLDNEAEARAEQAAAQAEQRERELQAQGSDQHLENLAEGLEDNDSSDDVQLCGGPFGHTIQPCAE